VSLWRTVSNHRCVEVGRTPRLGSSTCLVLFIPMKAAAVAETSTTTMYIKVVI